MRRLERLLSLGMWTIAFLIISPLLPAALAGSPGTPRDPGLPSDQGIQPVWLPGSPACADLAPEGQTWRQVDADPATGSYGDGVLKAAIALRQAMGGQTLDWDANLPPSAVLVHAGSDTNLYAYDLAAAVPSDTFLHAPVELDAPTFMPVDGVSFCYAPPPQDPGAPSGNGVQPVWMPGSPTCADLEPTGTTWQELRIGPVAEGSYGEGALRVSVVRVDSPAGQAFDWRTNVGVDAVIVRDEQQSNIYAYPPSLAATADTTLHAPLEPGTALLRPLGSVSLCYVPKPPDPGLPSDQGIQPAWHPGSPTCAELAPAGVTWREFTVQPVADGTYGDGLLSVNLARHDQMGGQTVGWTANLDVDAALVRGGGDTNMYTYQPPTALEADAELHAPVGADMLLPAIDEIAFCYPAPPHDPGPPSIEGVQPVWRDGSPTCASIAPAGTTWYQVTVEPIAGGTYGDGYLTVQLDHEPLMGGEILGWSSNVGVGAVLVQGGGNSNLYSYAPLSRQDDQLHAAVDQGTNLFYAIEQVDFCYEQAPGDPGAPSGNSVQPVWEPGDQSCASLAPAGTTWRELRVEPVASGTFGDGLLSVTLEHQREMGGPSVDWSSSTGIDAIWVAGEANGNLYLYEPPAEVSFDTFSHAPLGPDLLLEEIRYLSFCYDATPSIAVELDGDVRSKVGDVVTYNLLIRNDGDLPLDLVSVVDALLGDLTASARGAGCGNLTPGASCSFQAVREVQPTDPDPLVDSVTVTYGLDQPDSGTGTVQARDDHTTDLFQAAVAVGISGPDLARAGDALDYAFTLSNNSSEGAPSMVCTAESTLHGRIFDGVLPPGDTVLHLQRTARPTDPDPLANAVALNCSLEGFADSYHAEAALSTNLYAPSISLAHTGTDLAYVGYQASYSLVLRNDSSADTPPLDCTLANDRLGFARQVTLESGQEDRSVLPYTIPGTAPDPFISTVTAVCSPQGGGSPVEAAASWSTELFQARIDLEKTGDVLGRSGHSIDYLIVLENHSSPDAPDLECTLTDPLLDLVEIVTLAPGAAYPIAASYQVPAGSDDPLVNVAAVTCKTTGYPQTLVGQASHSTSLFEPAIALAETGPARSYVGGSVDYTITLRNDSSANTPDLACTIDDPMLGVSQPVTLASGDSEQLSVSGYVIPDNAQDPFLTTATATCSPVGDPTVLRAKASWSADLFQPAVELVKTGDALSSAGTPVGYAITLRNTSSADTPSLACTISDPMLQLEKQVSLAVGEVHALHVSDHVVPTDAQGAYTNTATAHCTAAGFDVAVDAESTWVTELYRPALLVIVDGPDDASVGEKVTYSYYIRNTSSPNTPPLDLLDIVDDKLGDLTQLAREAGCATLAPGNGTGDHCQFTVQYTVQPGDERGRDPAGWPTIVNTVVARYLPHGTSLEVTGSGTHSIALLQPSLGLSKATSPPSIQGQAPDASPGAKAGHTLPPIQVAVVIPAFLALYTCFPAAHPIRARARRRTSRSQRASR